MKKLIYPVLLSALFIFSGCSGTHERKGVNILLPEGGKLPKQISGVWKLSDEKIQWELQFDRNGCIEQAVHHISGAVLKPEETTIKPFVKVDGQEVYNCGTWTMEYTPTSRYLTLTIKIDYLTKDCPAVVEGTIDDTLKGVFNEDFTEWAADWYNNSVLEVSEPVSGKSVQTNTPEQKRYRGKLLFKKVPQ